ncbi:uncharacterized protein LOC106880706 isoform X2 [Octopus bimaculoides]|uniref:uncharacterized protein LOC106880706 isoform X2 n=1 Tax=Octopus bimaculoides TaxID=37653 RepID=UPI00071E3BBD|nr:uncharacterized protein LOC106880706 isoform X2 [Octopus bimaculoides]|eukprot:XP_014786267.1 PREDICTED: uncharacterized protein LOC106880706 [Octopus bimaculoides]
MRNRSQSQLVLNSSTDAFTEYSWITSKIGFYKPYTIDLLLMRGWFEVIPDDGRPVEYFDSIQGITAIKPKKFLVRTSTVGYELGEENGSVSWVPREIFPGEVLSTGMVYMDHRKTCLSTNMKNLFKRFLKYRTINTKKDQDLKYLQCFDGQGHEVMIPLIMTGVFSPVGDPNKKNYDAVYELKDLTKAFDLPVKAQLVHAEPNQRHYVPHGVLKLKTLDEDDCVVASKRLDQRETFELPLDEDLRYIRDIAPKSPLVRKLSTRSLVLPNYASKSLNRTPFFSNKTDQKPKVDLPLRVPTKDTKKPKAAGFIERFGARKTKKERAAFKALQEEGVFSSRLCKAEMPFDAFYSAYTEEANNSIKKNNGQESENKSEPENKAADGSISSQSSTSTITPTGPPLCSPESSLIDPFESQYAKICKKPSMMKRDLPPVPLDNKDDSETGTIVDEDGKLSMSSTDTLYEHLPEAPNPPPKSPSLAKPELDFNSKENEMSLVENEEDGYMVPSHLQRKKTQKHNLTNPIVVSQSRDVFQPNFIPKFYKDTTYANCGRPRNGYKSAFQHNSSLDRKLLSETSVSTSNLNRISHKPPPTTPCSRRNSAAAEHSSSRSRFQRQNNVQKICQCHQNPNLINCPHYSAELQRSSHTMDPNLTLRHHNMRRLKSAIEMLHFTDSFHETRPASFGSSCSPTEECCPHDHYDVKGFQQPYDYFEVGNNQPNHNPYSESDPGNRYFVRSVSVTGLSDNCAKHGDDSAISLCSKGDYGYQAGSDFSYTDYTDVFNDDGWRPPDNISSLSVQDVSRSLRYIGMKDRVVKRFANEQIDGQMLASLDWKLLQDGFPELNTLEVKKIIDFVNGWRPKKSVS